MLNGSAGDHVSDGDSYEELYVEHAPAARRVALSLVPRDVADDIVAEAFTRVLGAIRAGGGPGLTFRGYLLAAVRNLASDWLRARRRTTLLSDIDAEAGDRAAEPTPATSRISCGAEDQAEARAEARLVARAFARLSARWRAVLWHLEVEGEAPAAVAPLFGLSANGVSALAVRAREGLREAYLQEHVGVNIPVACRACRDALAAGARGRLSHRRRVAMDEHLQGCRACTELFSQLIELSSRLGAMLTPAALAGASAGLAAGRRALFSQAGPAGPWWLWPLHPAAGVTAGVAAASGLVLAVGVMPMTSPPPAHGAARPGISVSGLPSPGPGAPGTAPGPSALRDGYGNPGSVEAAEPVGRVTPRSQAAANATSSASARPSASTSAAPSGKAAKKAAIAAKKAAKQKAKANKKAAKQAAKASRQAAKSNKTAAKANKKAAQASKKPAGKPAASAAMSAAITAAMNAARHGRTPPRSAGAGQLDRCRGCAVRSRADR